MPKPPLTTDLDIDINLPRLPTTEEEASFHAMEDITDLAPEPPPEPPSYTLMRYDHKFCVIKYYHHSIEWSVHGIYETQDEAMAAFRAAHFEPSIVTARAKWRKATGYRF